MSLAVLSAPETKALAQAVLGGGMLWSTAVLSGVDAVEVWQKNQLEK